MDRPEDRRIHPYSPQNQPRLPYSLYQAKQHNIQIQIQTEKENISGYFPAAGEDKPPTALPKPWDVMLCRGARRGVLKLLVAQPWGLKRSAVFLYKTGKSFYIVPRLSNDNHTSEYTRKPWKSIKKSYYFIVPGDVHRKSYLVKNGNRVLLSKGMSAKNHKKLKNHVFFFIVADNVHRKSYSKCIKVGYRMFSSPGMSSKSYNLEYKKGKS